MNVSSAKRNIPKDIRSLKSKGFFMSITSILCRMKVNHPVSRLPVATMLLDNYIMSRIRTQVWFCKVKKIIYKSINNNGKSFYFTKNIF